MQKLEEQGATLKAQKEKLEQEIAQLQQAIAQYKTEYAESIREIESIKAEMSLVTRKVERAEALLQSLNEEKQRWEATSKSFDLQMSTLIGDCLVAASFLTYAGIFDHRVRRGLLMEWCETLAILGVPFRSNISLIDYLSRPADRLQWQGHGLPSDDLYVENAILLERFNRFPLVVDPSGQATAYILSKYAPQKIQTTSFLDASFFKTLGSAIRFGTALLVQDVENVDPILNPVLNKEFQKTGGRTLIRLGNEDIDYSPKFMIVLTTRDPAARFAPDLCSRVTVINFTVTPASLESQALSAILRAERPDVDRRRTEVLRLQGEQNVKIRELEESLLNQISAVRGAILDDDTVIRALEQIKSEAADLTLEAAQTEEIMAEVRAVSRVYEPLGTAMSRVYFALERLSDVGFLYQYSLQFFLGIVHQVLNQTGTKNVGSDPSVRLKALQTNFFEEVARRIMRGLLHEDKLMFAVRLAQIALEVGWCAQLAIICTTYPVRSRNLASSCKTRKASSC
jgi:dynein heavy chain 1